jgi:HK97 family phage major capsid protein
MLVRQDLADTLGSEIDRAAIDGTGSGSQPKGLMNTSGINQVSFTASGPTWAQVVTMEQNVAEDNALKGNLGFLSHPEFIGYFKTTEKASGSGQFIMDNSGRVNSYPARFSANVPGNYSIFGDWSQMVFGAWGGIKLAVNPYEKFASGSVQVRAIAAVDFAIRHTQAFEIGRVVNT